MTSLTSDQEKIPKKTKNPLTEKKEKKPSGFSQHNTLWGLQSIIPCGLIPVKTSLNMLCEHVSLNND